MFKNKDTIEIPGKHDIEKIRFSGFIAQDVSSVAEGIGYDFSGVDKLGKVWGLRYSDFVPSLVKAVQEQQQQIVELQKQVEELRKLLTK